MGVPIPPMLAACAVPNKSGIASLGSGERATIAIATGSNIKVVAVFEIHIDKNALAAIKPKTRLRLLFPPNIRIITKATRSCAPLFSIARDKMKPPSKSSMSLSPYASETDSIGKTPDRGSTASGTSDVTGIGTGSKIHQSTHRTVRPRVIAASSCKPRVLLSIVTPIAVIGPSHRATRLISAVRSYFRG